MRKLLRWPVLRWVVLGVAVVFVAIQLVPVDRSSPPISAEIPATPEARAVLRRACYDCHSHETRWPWYGRIAPVSWLLARDVRNGREELDFSTWDQYTTRRRVRKLKEILEQVAEGEMPPWFYLSVHREAVLSAEDRETLRKWVLSMPEWGTASGEHREVGDVRLHQLREVGVGHPHGVLVRAGVERDPVVGRHGRADPHG